MDMSDYDLVRINPRLIADKIVRLYRNAKTLADIFKTNQDISVEAIKDIARNVKMPEILPESHSASKSSTPASPAGRPAASPTRLLSTYKNVARASEPETPIAEKPASRPADSSSAFRKLAATILNLLKNDANLAKILPDQPGDPMEEDGVLVCRAPSRESPLALRLTYDPANGLIGAGWEGNVGDGLVGRLRKWRKKARIDASFDIDYNTGIFSVYIAAAADGNKPALAEPGAVADMVTGIYEPTLNLYKMVTD